MKNQLNILKFCMYKSKTLRIVIGNIKQIPRNLKFAWQRIKWGFCEGDTWGLDIYLARVIANSVAYLRDHHMSYVDRICIGGEWKEMTNEQYTEYLDNIVKCFDIVQSDEEDLIEKYEGIETYSDVRVVQDKYLHKGFELLEAVYWGLWD